MPADRLDGARPSDGPGREPGAVRTREQEPDLGELSPASKRHLSRAREPASQQRRSPAGAPAPDLNPDTVPREPETGVSARLEGLNLARRWRAQCRKCRRPVITIATPASSQAATTSASRFEPPGWMNAAA